MKKFLLGYAAHGSARLGNFAPIHDKPCDEINRWIEKQHASEPEFAEFLAYIRDNFELWYEVGISDDESRHRTIEVWGRVDDTEAVKFSLLYPEFASETEWVTE